MLNIKLFYAIFIANYYSTFSAQTQTPTIDLNDGHQIPVLGIGTYLMGNERTVVNRIKDAIKTGYRHIDTAWLYGNEKAIGRALNDLISGGDIKRDDVFVTSKVWNTHHSRPKAIESIRESIDSLGLEYLDLALIHFPMAWREDTGDPYPTHPNGTYADSGMDFMETWRALEEARDNNLTKSIGVSNFNHRQLERVLREGRVRPAINQVESHAYLTQQKLLEFCRNNSVVMEAYSPLGHGNRRLLSDRALRDIGNKYNKTVAQVLIKYQLARGVVTIPKSSRRDHVRENYDVFDFNLTVSDRRRIDRLNRNYKVFDFDRTHREYPFGASVY